MGIDGGGVFKEFLTDLSKEVFDSDRGLWLANKKNELYPSPGSYATEGKFYAFDCPLGVQFPAKPTASIGTGSLEGYWVRRCTRESWWTLRSQASSSLRFARLAGRIVLPTLILLLQWLGKQSFLDDLASLDPDLYQGLIFLKHYPGNPEELSLNFTIADEGEIFYQMGDSGAHYVCRIRRRAGDRPQAKRKQHPCHA